MELIMEPVDNTTDEAGFFGTGFFNFYWAFLAASLLVVAVGLPINCGQGTPRWARV